MAQQSQVALNLKRLRERAGMSVRDLADAIGRPTSSYAWYEDGFKKEALPLDLVQSLIPVLVPRGIAEPELLALAGLYVEGAAETLRLQAMLSETATVFEADYDETHPVTRLRRAIQQINDPDVLAIAADLIRTKIVLLTHRARANPEDRKQ